MREKAFNFPRRIEEFLQKEPKKMGHEGKSRKRRSSPSPSPYRDEDAKRRKHRKRDDKEKRRSRDDDDDKRRTKKKKKSSHEHSTSRERKEKKSQAKHKLSNKASDSEFKELSMDDYFSKNNEFSTWLKEEKSLYFSDLSSEEARNQFSSFIMHWNSQKLEPRYYEGIAVGPRTAHNWRIRKES